MKTTVQTLTTPYQEVQLNHFHHLHQHPELPFAEYETSAYIKKALQSFGIPVDESFVDTTSVVAVLEGAEAGPTIAFRADMDALPIQEETDLPYASVNPGVMHACGHDSHAATLLTLAQLLSEHKELVKGRVKFIFQAAEEQLPGGAKPLCEAGVMNDVDTFYAFHSVTPYPTGVVVSNPGATSAAVGSFEARVSGSGGHVAIPQVSRNPLNVACNIVNTLNQLLGTIDPMTPTLFGITYMHCGDKENVIADEAVFGGSIRSFDNATVEMLYHKVEQICRNLSEAAGCTCEVSIVKGYPATMNAAKEQALVVEVANALGYEHRPTELALTGEDCSYYLLEKPGCFFTVGMSDPDHMDAAMPHHNSKFQLDDRGLHVALEMMVGIYLTATKA